MLLPVKFLSWIAFERAMRPFGLDLIAMALARKSKIFEREISTILSAPKGSVVHQFPGPVTRFLVTSHCHTHIMRRLGPLELAKYSIILPGTWAPGSRLGQAHA